VLPALIGRSLKGRDHLVEQGGRLDFRNGRWEWIAADSFAQGGPPLALRKGRWKWITTGHGTGKLYDLAQDPAETKDLASQRPTVARELAAFLKQLRDQGRSRR
jgi:arylsulfatase A-like enzyme